MIRMYACPVRPLCLISSPPGDYGLRLSARSLHPGGVQVSLGDGSVHFISENIDIDVGQLLATPDGGEVIGQF